MPDFVSPYEEVDAAQEADIVRRYRRLHDSCRTARFVLDTHWLTAIALCEGHQWLIDQTHSLSTSSGRRVVQSLPESIDGGVDNIRVSLNRIRDHVEEISALNRIAPKGWEGIFTPDERYSSMGRVDIRLARPIWRDYLSTINLPAEHSLANEWCSECGSGIVKAVPDQENPYGWSLIMVPLERMVWDVAVKTPEIADHNEWADTMAWPAEEIERRYGLRFPKKENLPTLGTLQAFDSAVNQIRSQTSPGATESRTPAVLVTEYFTERFKNLHVLIHTGTSENQVRAVWSGPNPYGGCPYLKTDLGLSLVSPWGIGIPMRLRAEQQVYNLAITCIVRHLLTVSAVRWIYEAGSVEDADSVFSPRVGSPIAVSRLKTDQMPFVPQMMKPAEMNAIAWNLSAMVPQLMGEKAHLAPVLRGITSPRGESGGAIREKLAQAGRTFVAKAETDARRVKAFLTHHLRVITEQVKNPKTLFDAVGPELHRPLMDHLKAGSALKTQVTIELPQDAIQPKTPEEKEAMLFQLAAHKAIDANELKWELFRQTGRTVTAEQERALASAAEENRMFLEGASFLDVDAVHFEDHPVHIFVHKEIPNARWMHSAITPEVLQNVTMHLADHYEEMGDERLIVGAVEAEMQGQAGATDQAVGNLMQPSPLQGSLVAPPATASQYDLRNTEAEQAMPGA